MVVTISKTKTGFRMTSKNKLFREHFEGADWLEGTPEKLLLHMETIAYLVNNELKDECLFEVED